VRIIVAAADTTDLNAQWLARSRAAIWHPCTQMKVHETLPLVPIARRRRVAVRLRRKRYLDAVSSWWVNLFGHANRASTARWWRNCPTSTT
jgi:adenosylmethionine-8-amino-7-oxononanoate aminotransferase